MQALLNYDLGELGRSRFVTYGLGWEKHFHPTQIRDSNVILWIENSSLVPTSTFRDEIPR